VNPVAKVSSMWQTPAAALSTCTDGHAYDVVVTTGKEPWGGAQGPDAATLVTLLG
jgi:hypothetical protein